MSQVQNFGTGGTPPPPTPYYSMTPYIVGSDTHSQYTTIQAGINAAHTAGASTSAPLNVYVKPGTYHENLTGYDGINVFCFDTSGGSFGMNPEKAVILNGTVTLATANANFKMQGMNFQPATGNCFLISAGNLALSQCYANITAGTMFVFTTTGAKKVNLMGVNFKGDATSSCMSHDGANATIAFNDQNAFLNFPQQTSTLSGPAGNFTWNSFASTIKFNVDAECANFIFAAQSDSIQGFSGAETFLTTGASTTGYLSTPLCNYFSFDPTQLLNIGNANFTFDFLFCVFDQPYDFTVQPGQITNSSQVLVQGASSRCGVFADAKTGFNQTYEVTKQAFLNTSSASPVDFITIPVNNNSSIISNGIIASQDAAFSDITNGTFEIAAQNVGGVVSIIGGGLFNSKKTSTGNINFTVSGTNIVIQAIAPSADPYNWVSTYRFMQINTNA